MMDTSTAEMHRPLRVPAGMPCEAGDAAPAESRGQRLLALECFGHLLESSRDAVALLDAAGIVFYANACFTALYAELALANPGIQARPLQLPALRELRARLEQWRRAGGEAGRRPAEAGMEIQLAATRRRYCVSARAICCALEQDGMCEVTMLVLRDLESETRERLHAFRARYTLTSMECRVLELFLHGKDLRTISILLHMSIHTARAHMKALLAKTGCCRQPELVCLLNGTPTGSLQMAL